MIKMIWMILMTLEVVGAVLDRDLAQDSMVLADHKAIISTILRARTSDLSRNRQLLWKMMKTMVSAS